MLGRRTEWVCRDCGHRHSAPRRQCLRCDYIGLRPVEGGGRQFDHGLFALLPALLAAVTVAVIAFVVFH